MAKRTFQINTLTPTATADTVALVNSTYIADLLGASGTQRTYVDEIEMGGQATASAPTFMQLARDSTIGVGAASGGTDAAVDPATAALAAPVVVGNSFATSAPQRSATLKLLNLSFNAFGGIVRWKARDSQDAPTMVGNTASLGAMNLSAFTGGTPGAMGAHVTYETL